MKTIITIFILMISMGASQDTIPSALLDFSNYNNYEEIDRPVERFYGLNPYNIGGFLYTKSTNISTNKIKQQDVDFHWGSNIITFSFGLNVKKYLFNSKYRAISYFSSFSSSLGMIPTMSEKNADIAILDIHNLSVGIDFNIIRFDNFDIRLTIGLCKFGTIAFMTDGAYPVLNVSIRTGVY